MQSLMVQTLRKYSKDQQVTADGKGFIEITLDAEGKVTQSEKGLVWGVIGDATSSGWDKDTQMEYDTTTRLWTVVTRCSIRNSNLEPIMTGDSIMEQKKVNFLSWPVTCCWRSKFQSGKGKSLYYYFKFD